jgi:UDP-2,3-diacylglucosamine pyrophosphatase LpxH
MENVQRGAINEAVMRRCQIVCCGHTHMAAARPGGISYYNSGSWVEHDCTWLTLKDGLASLVHAD